MNQRRPTILLFTFILLIFTLVHIPATPARGPKKIAILPFTVNADRDVTFFKQGVMDMLGTRLAWKDKMVMDEGEIMKRVAELEGPLNRDAALMVGKALGADYVIMGSITLFGESLSIDARVLDVAKSKEVVTVFNQCKGMDEVIPTVNQFAKDINSKITERPLVPPQQKPASKEIPALKKEQVVKQEVRRPETDDEKTAIMEPTLTVKIPFEIVGLDVGDVDGDRRNELVLIDHKNVYVYKFDENRLVRLRKIPGRRSDNYVSLDVADLNGNGKAEIFISNIVGDTMGSLVLEWDAGNIKALAKRQNWFFRVLRHPTMGERLIGQRRKISGSFTGGVHFLTLDNKEIRKGELVLSSPKANVFNFTMGDMEGNGRIYTAVLAEDGDLLLINPEGEVDLEDRGGYGGSPIYIHDASQHVGVSIMSHLVFLSPRLFMWDIDSDGKMELVVCRNTLKTGRILGRVRLFKSGRVLFLKMTGLGLEVTRKTGKVVKCATDYQIKDVDNDGQAELVVAVTGPKLIGKIKKSRVAIYDLN